MQGMEHRIYKGNFSFKMKFYVILCKILIIIIQIIVGGVYKLLQPSQTKTAKNYIRKNQSL